jgi:hypothetical protein
MYLTIELDQMGKSVVTTQPKVDTKKINHVERNNCLQPGMVLVYSLYCQPLYSLTSFITTDVQCFNIKTGYLRLIVR